MCAFDTYTYLIFPISTLIWGLYKFFKEDDDEYCRRNGIDPGIDIGWLFGSDDYYGYDRYNNYGSYRSSNINNTTTRTNSYGTCSRYSYSNPEYKTILPRCRRNSMVTTDKVKTKNEQQHE
jgi:hypothetical protein